MAFGDSRNKKLTGATTDRLGKTRPRSRHRVNAFKKTIDFDTECKTHLSSRRDLAFTERLP
jgi:hypothetical protein